MGGLFGAFLYQSYFKVTFCKGKIVVMQKLQF